jgi:hypothetical protein
MSSLATSTVSDATIVNGEVQPRVATAPRQVGRGLRFDDLWL